jgi:C_GCAxxG_C_C family probable redox protein
MTPEDMARRAEQLFLEGFHCSQAVFQAGAEMLEKQAPEVVAALAPFGGGMGSTGGVCGSLPVALASLGLTTGKTEPHGKDHRAMWRLSYRMVKSFEEITARYGGANCTDIARINWKDREQVKDYRTNPDSSRKECVRVVGETARKLGELLQELDKGS